jgi:hypothetical protein
MWINGKSCTNDEFRAFLRSHASERIEFTSDCTPGEQLLSAANQSERLYLNWLPNSFLSAFLWIHLVIELPSWLAGVTIAENWAAMPASPGPQRGMDFGDKFK